MVDVGFTAPEVTQMLPSTIRGSSRRASVRLVHGICRELEAASKDVGMARRRLRRAPRVCRASAVDGAADLLSSGSMSASIALSRNACSYCCNPRPSGHAAMATLASPPYSFSLAQFVAAREYSALRVVVHGRVTHHAAIPEWRPF